jgi:hypothetical protein
MLLSDYLTILTIILGNGAIVAIIGLVFRYYEHKSQKDFEARKEAKEYYMKLYALIAILDELIRAYQRSIKKGKAEVFIFKECRYNELTSKEILDDFNEAYEAFSAYYIKKKCEGYEIFVSEKLAKLLIEFWNSVKTFYEKSKLMEDEKKTDSAHKIAKDLTKNMEKLFGLK